MAKVLKCFPQGLSMPQSSELLTLARHSGYRVKAMARELGCSSRWLEIQCHRRFALTPHAWLVWFRAEEIQKQARTGASAKVLCQQVGFADTASFCHGLKRATGCTLRELRGLGPNGCSRKDNKEGSLPVIRTRQSILAEKSGRCQHETLT
jgi:AraC-like DNA-binding protein